MSDLTDVINAVAPIISGRRNRTAVVTALIALAARLAIDGTEHATADELADSFAVVARTILIRELTTPLTEIVSPAESKPEPEPEPDRNLN